MRAVNLTNDTVLTFSADFIAQHPEFAGVTVRVPPGSLYSDNGTRGGMVGIAPVPPDRLPGPLNEGLYITDVITIQTDGPSNFGVPVPVCFPNLPDPSGYKLPPGAKSALWSFNHDTGRFEIVGSATVTEDGMLACTDPGVGILAPGWHLMQQGAAGGGGSGGSGPGGGPGGPGGGPGGGGPGGGGPDDGSDDSNGGDDDWDDDGDDEDDDPDSCPTNNGTNPILLQTGEKYEEVVDLRIEGVGMDFVWRRTYSSRFGMSSAQGNNWDFSYNFHLMPEGRGIRVCDGKGRYDLNVPAVGLTNVFRALGFFHEVRQETNGAHCLVKANQKRYNFLPIDGSPYGGKLESISDRNGNTMFFFHDAQGRLRLVRDTLGRDITISYNEEGFISAVTDFTGRSVRYTHYGRFEAGGSFGDLKTVTHPAVTGTPNGNDFPNGKTTN